MVWVRLRISECRSENLELCETFWRHNIECFRVHESLLLKCTRVCLGTIEIPEGVEARTWNTVV